MRPDSYTKFGEITQNRAITPFKVTDFGTNRKLICDVLLVVNINLPPILHRFQVMADFGQIFASDEWLLHFNAFAGGESRPLRISG